MPEDSYDGYLDGDGIFHVPGSPEEEAILKELGLTKWTLPKTALEADEDGVLIDYTPDATDAYRVTLVPPSAAGGDLNDALLNQAAAQIRVIDSVGGMSDNLSKLSADRNTQEYDLAAYDANEQFRRTQRPLARTAVTGGYGPGQFARLAKDAAFDYDLARNQRDSAYSYAQATIAQQLEAAKVNRVQDQLNVLSGLTVQPTEQQALLAQMLGG